MRASTGFAEHSKTDRQTVVPVPSMLEWCNTMARYVKRLANFGLTWAGSPLSNIKNASDGDQDNDWLKL